MNYIWPKRHTYFEGGKIQVFESIKTDHRQYLSSTWAEHVELKGDLNSVQVCLVGSLKRFGLEVFKDKCWIFSIPGSRSHVSGSWQCRYWCQMCLPEKKRNKKSLTVRCGVLNSQWADGSIRTWPSLEGRRGWRRGSTLGTRSSPESHWQRWWRSCW